MPELVLVRHGKSDWGDPGLADHERTLNDRGRGDAPRMAARLAGSGVGIERLLSSTAVRARTTAEIFGETLGLAPELDPDLYLATAETLMATAAACGAESVMVVAHDPGLSELASRCSGGAIDHMPACAVARFTWRAGSWADASGRAADEWSLDTPRSASGR
ncbi:histidine phosphatase family protein [Leucobacter tardus]|uniref:Histidine phosphatase family protein n=1 Tax=Leucobacter tardus TaxID=501483 RepID=A0A939TRN7_9MICO|nr:histidine phosphatase family protein [Leucobacter tardus]MBO2990222.1 histidine phosphatase family protein [Leucobacter tardus]